MAQNIANISAKVSADASQAKAGFQQATDAAKKFVDTTNSKLQSLQQSAPSMLNSILTGGIIASVPILAPLANLSNQFKQMKMEAGSLGVTIKELQQLKFFSKGHFDEVNVGVGHFQRTLDEALHGSHEARDAFDRLGISWKQLADLPLPEQLAMIGDKLRTTDSQLTKNAATTAIFGRGAKDLIPILQGGSEAMDKAAKKAEWANTATVWMNSLSSSTETFKNFLGEALDKGTRLAVLSGAFLGGADADLRDKIMKKFDEEAKAAGDKSNNKGTAESAANEMARKMVATLKEKNFELEKGADLVQRYNLRAAGANQDLVNQVHRQQEITKALEDSKKIADEIETPMQKFGKALDRISELARKGFLSQKDAAKAAEAAMDRLGLKDKSGHGGVDHAEALAHGSQGALSAVNAFNRQSLGVRTPQENERDAQQLQAIQMIQRLVEKLADKAPPKVLDV